MESRQKYFYAAVSVVVSLLIASGSILTWAISESRKVSLIEGRMYGSDPWIFKWMEERDKRIKNIEKRLTILEKEVKKKN